MTAERSLQAGCCRKISAVEWPLEPRPIDRLSTGWKSAALRNRPFTYGREPLQQCSAVTSDSLWLLSSAANWHSRPDSVSTLPCQEAARRRSGPAGPDGVEAQRSRVVDLDSDVVSGRLQPMEWPSSSCTAPNSSCAGRSTSTWFAASSASRSSKGRGQVPRPSLRGFGRPPRPQVR